MALSQIRNVYSKNCVCSYLMFYSNSHFGFVRLNMLLESGSHLNKK